MYERSNKMNEKFFFFILLILGELESFLFLTQIL